MFFSVNVSVLDLMGEGSNEVLVVGGARKGGGESRGGGGNRQVAKFLSEPTTTMISYS